jgi:hypothetical protein
MEGYKDEFGPIDPMVYLAAREIWRRAVRFGEFALHDRGLVFNLMMKAAADVSRLTLEGRRIQYLKGYLRKTFERLVVEEREKTLPRSEPLTIAPEAVANIIDDLHRKILVRELFTNLSNYDRTLLWYWMTGLSDKETASRLGRTQRAVQKQRERLIARLKTAFANTDAP